MTTEMTTTGATAPATMDANTLAKLTGAVNSRDTGMGGDALPKLKINYDHESEFDRGVWLVGQAKDKASGAIIDQGIQVVGLIPIVVRDRYSYYNQTNTALNCNSPFFEMGETVYGSTFKKQCGKGCPMRAKERGNDKCKVQKVVFGFAYTATGKLVECMTYIGGMSYMPFADYIANTSKIRTAEGYVQIPPFSFVCYLGATAERNGATTYFVGTFKQSEGLVPDVYVDRFITKRTEYYNMLDRQSAKANESAPETVEAEIVEPAPVMTAPTPAPVAPVMPVAPEPAPVMAAPESAPGIPVMPAMPTAPTIPVAPASAGLPAHNGTTVPFDVEPVAPAPSEDIDIEESIKKALAAA